MTWLWILLAIIFLLVCLLTAPIKIVITYDGDAVLFLRVLSIRIPLFPRPKKKIRPSNFTVQRNKKRLLKDAERARKKQEQERKKKRKKAEKKAEKKQNKQKKLPKGEVTVKDETSMLSLLLAVVGRVLDKFFGKLRVDVVRMRITVGGADATQIAMMYGVVSQGVAYLTELIAQKTKLRRIKNDQICVIPNFLAKETTADIAIVFSVNIWLFINIAFTLAFRFIKEKISRESELT